ncbi:uncharacterized protein ACO6RY_17532 [Pungitius sinensis]
MPDSSVSVSSWKNKLQAATVEIINQMTATRVEVVISAPPPLAGSSCSFLPFWVLLGALAKSDTNPFSLSCLPFPNERVAAAVIPDVERLEPQMGQVPFTRRLRWSPRTFNVDF